MLLEDISMEKCKVCNGKGRIICKACGGSGENHGYSLYSTYRNNIDFLEKSHIEYNICSECFGTGYVECKCCNKKLNNE